MRPKSLKAKFILYIIPLVLFIALTFLGFFIYRTNQVARSNLTEFGFHLAQDLSYGSELAVSAEDPVLLRPSFESTFQEKEVILVAVYNREGRIISAKKKKELEKRITKEVRKKLLRNKEPIKKVSTTDKGNEFYDFYTPIIARGEASKLGTREKGEVIGFGRVGVSLGSTYAQIKQIAIWGGIITLLVALFGVSISVFLASRMLGPIRSLTKGAKEIAQGNLDYRIKVDTGDEIEELAGAFNQMTASLQRSRVALKKTKENLEGKVRKRTRQLREFSENLEQKVKGRTKELEESRKAALNILEDVKKARREAEKERDTTLAIINNLADGLIVFDQEGKISLVNPKLREFFGIRKKDLYGKTIGELSEFPILKPLVVLLNEDVHEVTREEFKVEQEMVLEVTSISMPGAFEKTGKLVILHDITREKRVKRMKTEFVSLAAHQLRTPLSAIKWTLKMLLDEDLGKINKEQEEFIEKTYRSNERMISLINDLLSVTRIEEGRYVHKPKLVQLEDLVQRVIDSSKDEIKRKMLKVNYDTPDQKLPKVKIDEEKIELAIQNLIDNAVIYSDSGGKITITLEEEEDKVKFSIEDNGIGIPEGQQDRVFSKFFRAANAKKVDTEGSGLGLFIVKNIIEAHGGKIWFGSEKGEGTTFYFTLPVEE